MKVLQALIIVSIFSIGNLASAQSGSNKNANKFNLIDGDKNEVITIREMTAYYNDKTNKRGEPLDGKKIFYELDVNTNSIVTISEFVEDVDWIVSYKSSSDSAKKDQVSANKKSSKKEVEGKKVKDKLNATDTNNNDTLSNDEVTNFHTDKTEKTTGKLNLYASDAHNDDKIILDEFVKKPDLELEPLRLKDSKEAIIPSTKRSASDGYIKKRIKLFDVVDTDHNFKVTLKELKDYYKGKTNNKGNPVNAQFKFCGYDSNDDGVLELSEFATRINIDLARKKYKALKQ